MSEFGKYWNFEGHETHMMTGYSAKITYFLFLKGYNCDISHSIEVLVCWDDVGTTGWPSRMKGLANFDCCFLLFRKHAAQILCSSNFILIK